MKLFLVLFPAIFYLLSCSEGPRNEDALVDESLIINPSSVAGRKYYIDSMNSFVSWVGANEEIRHYGIVRIGNGFITLKDSIITGGIITIQMSSLQVLDLQDNPEEKTKLLSTLNSVHVFNVEEFPEARFEIDSVREIAPTKELKTKAKQDLSAIIPTHTLFGKLTLKGKTSPVGFPVKIDLRYYRLQSSAEFFLDLSKFGIANSFNAQLDNSGNAIPEKVEINFDIIASAR